MINDAVASNGLSVLPSQTNFVFVNIGDLNANEYRDQMKQHGILIQGQYGSFKNWSRVSMGKIEDIQRYVDALPKVLDALGN